MKLLDLFRSVRSRPTSAGTVLADQRDNLAPGGDPVPDIPVRDTSPGGAEPEGEVAVKLPAVNFPPRGAQTVIEYGEADIGIGQVADIITINVPGSLELVLTNIGFSAEEEHMLQVLNWSVIIGAGADPITGGGNPVPGLFNKNGGAGSVSEPQPIRAHVPGPDTVHVLITQYLPLFVVTHYFATLWGYFCRSTYVPAGTRPGARS